MLLYMVLSLKNFQEEEHDNCQIISRLGHTIHSFTTFQGAAYFLEIGHYAACVPYWSSVILPCGLLYRCIFDNCSIANHYPYSEAILTNANLTSSRNCAVRGRFVPWTRGLDRRAWVEGG